MKQSSLKAIYHQDFNLWIQEMQSAIRNHRFEDIDWDSLLEELADLGKSEKRALVSNVLIVLAHLLKLTVQADAPDAMRKSWLDSIDEHRKRILIILKKNPSLQSWMPEAINEAYPDARDLAFKQGQRAAFGILKPSVEDYPQNCPFSTEQTLDENFYG